MDIGILGGTFDPIHLGHLTIAEEARVKLRLAQVLFVLAGQPWLKADRGIAPAAQRLEMVKRAIAANPCFELSTIEVDCPGPSYAVDTIGILQEQLGAKARFFFLLGWDALAELPQWKEPAKLVQLCQLVAVPRPECSSPDLEALEASIPGIAQRLVLLDIPPIDISSSDIRQRVARGLSIRHLVSGNVEKYIEKHELYRQGETENGDGDRGDKKQT